MAYEYGEFVDAMRFGLTMSDKDTTDPIWNMVDEVVAKAKAMDEIEHKYWASGTAENFAYEFVRIFEKHFSNDLEDE